MWNLLIKLLSGVLCVYTHDGPRYLAFSAWERLYLVWAFRHFRVLPEPLLNDWLRTRIRDLFRENQFLNPELEGLDGRVIGTTEPIRRAYPPGRIA